MSRFYSYLNSSKEILSAYSGEEPFASFLKKYFSQHKKYGSKDRKQISHVCYCYFRLGKAALSVAVEERILMALFLCSTERNEIFAAVRPDWNDKTYLSVEEKCAMFNLQVSILNVFPWKEELSEGIEYEKFCGSFFIQPDLFLRIRPGKETIVKQKLEKAGVTFIPVSETCLALPNSSKLDTIVELNKEVIVQDYNSQRVAEFLPTTIDHRPLTVWDCCAASGGKSIMAKDVLGNIDLAVSDVRASILHNLKKRFAEAGIKNYKSFVADLSTVSSFTFTSKHSQYDLVICDVPCSGSGTWSRTPEQLYYFEEKKIEEYASLQKKIVANVITHVKPGGYFLYITCSVFQKENEEVVEFIKQNSALEISKMELLKGYDKKADTMFAALLQRKL